MPTIAVANQTRGVAKTTTTLDLEAALHEIDKRVLLVGRDQMSSFNLESSLAGLLETVKGQYDYILIDCDNSPCAATLQATPPPADFETFALEGPQQWLGISD